ncbi:MAG: GreA/GreB family elongation factor [Pseudomonadota bacterium]
MRIYLSSEGMERLRAAISRTREELAALRAEKAIAYTQSGDTWHDNPGFNDLEQQEHRKALQIRALEEQLRGAVLFVLERRPTERVALGAIVRFIARPLTGVPGSRDGEEEQVFEIGGHEETDLKLRRIGYSSPLGRGLMGLAPGESQVTGAAGVEIEYEVVELLESWDEVDDGH